MTFDGHKLAHSFRHAADHAPAIRHPVWTDGFSDGLRFAAAMLDLAVDDRLALENIGEMLETMNADRPIRVKDTSRWPPREKT